MYPLTENEPIYVTIRGENNPTNGAKIMPDKSSYERLKSNARVTAYFTQEERNWIDEELVPNGEPRAEYLRRLIYDEAVRQGKKPPFDIKRLGSE